MPDLRDSREQLLYGLMQRIRADRWTPELATRQADALAHAEKLIELYDYVAPLFPEGEYEEEALDAAAPGRTSSRDGGMPVVRSAEFLFKSQK